MSQPRKILVIQPSWVGDAIMATPALRALRELYPSAQISYLLRRYVKPLYVGMPWADQLITYRTGKTRSRTGKGLFDVAARLRAGKFDLAILLTNSFKTALMCAMANIPRQVGYDRDGRGFLLTDRLLPTKDNGRFVPTPIIKSYLGLVKYLGSEHRNLKMELFVTDSDRRVTEQVFARSGLEADLCRPGAAGRPPMILLNPGANYGAAKCWRPEYFAEIADRFIREQQATVLITAAPKERPIVESIKRYMKHSAVDLSANGITLGALKEITRRSDLMVTNDTGPRHIAAAMDIPVVTIFGPTHPEWTEIYYGKERQIAEKVFCGPCQKKVCPLDHRCMKLVTPARVYAAAQELLNAGSKGIALPIVTS